MKKTLFLTTWEYYQIREFVKCENVFFEDADDRYYVWADVNEEEFTKVCNEKGWVIS